MSTKVDPRDKHIFMVMKERERQFRAIPTLVTRSGGPQYFEKHYVNKPYFGIHCEYLLTQEDRNGDVAISYCKHPNNPKDEEGNCTPSNCPIKKERGIHNG